MVLTILFSTSDKANKRTMVNSKDVNEINSLIVAQLAAEKNKTAIPIVKIDRDYREETGERIPFAKLGYPKLVDYLKTVPGVKVIEVCNTYYVNFMGTEDSRHIVDLVSKQRSKYPPRNTQNYTRYSRPSSNRYGSSIKTNNINIRDTNGSVFVDDSFWNFNLDNNHQITNSCEIDDLDCDDYIDCYKIDSKKHVINHPNTIKPYKENAGHQTLIYPDISENTTDTIKQREYTFSKNKHHVSTVMSKRIKFRLEKLIQNHSQGIWCSELLKLYEQEYKTSLEWTNLGFHRLSDFTAHLSDIFHVVGPQLNGDFKLYDAKKPLPNDKPTTKPEKLTTLSMSNINGDIKYPDDVITIEETVGQVLVTNFKKTDYIDENKNPMVEVAVVEAYSPSFFWIRLLKNNNKFPKMMRSLREFYTANYQRYAVPITMLERGLNIACVFYGIWHRAIIKSVDPNCRVTVLFYDYGTVDKYPSSEIFYLHRSFTALPAQAIPCGLYGVAPHVGDKWPKRIRDWFTQRVCNRPMWATIVEVDYQRNSMLVTLADTSGKDDYFINDRLIDKKMAQVKKIIRVRPKNFPYERYLQCQDIKKSFTAEKLRDISNQDQLKDNIKTGEVCPTCGNYITKSVQENSKVSDKLENTLNEIEDKNINKVSPYQFNMKESFDKVTSWLDKQEISNLGVKQAINAEAVLASLDNTNNTLTKNKITKEDINSNTKYPYSVEENIPIAPKVVKDKLKNNNNENKKNVSRSNDFTFKKLICSDSSISSENNNLNFTSTNFVRGKSVLMNDFQSSDENSHTASVNITDRDKKIVPIDWDEIKTALIMKTYQNNYNPDLSIENKLIFTEKLLSTPKEKIQTLSKMNESFENYIKAYHGLVTFQGSISKLRPEHSIIKSDIITPMVVKTLNIIDKPYESTEIIIPDNIKEIIQGNFKDFVNNVSSKYSLNDSQTLEIEQKEDDDWEQEFNCLEISSEETMPEESNTKEDVEINENDGDSCEEASTYGEQLNFLYHATLGKNGLKKFSQLELESNKHEESSELDSDDFDYVSTEISGNKNQDQESSIGYKSFDEHYENINNHCNIIEISPMKQDDDTNANVNLESTISKTEHIPVFNDNESFTDDSEMDVCIEYDFMSQFYHHQNNVQKNGCTLKEINSDDGNNDELSEVSDNISL